MRFLRSKLARRIVIAGLSLVIIIAGITIFDKNTGIVEKTNKLAGEVAGLALTGKFLNYKIPGVLPASAVAPAPYQNVSGDVAISGNVGIGTTSRGAKLDVNGYVVIRGDDTAVSVQSNTNHYFIQSKSNNAGLNEKWWDIRDDTTTSKRLLFRALSDDYLSNNSWLEVYRNGYNIDKVVFPNGNVGIGNATPEAPLSIRGAVNTTIGQVGDGKLLTVGNTGSGDNYIMSGVRDSSAGDPGILLLSQNEGGWIAGLDNSDSNKLKFSSTWNNLADGAKVTFTTDGNVGIGIVTPASKLDILDNINDTQLRVRSDMEGPFSEGGKASIFVENIDSNNNGGPSAIRLARANATKWAWVNDVDGTATDNLTLWQQGDQRRMVIGTSGGVTINSLGTGYVCSSSSGLLTSGASCSTSDVRLKTNITDISTQTNVLSALNKLHGVYYNWDLTNPTNAGQSSKRQVGMVAQDVEKVLPELVSVGSDGYRRLDYAKFTGYLLEVAKAQQKQLASLFNIIDVVNKIGRFVLIETQKLVVSGVDILERLNTLSQKVDAQQQEIDSLKKEIEQLKAK